MVKSDPELEDEGKNEDPKENIESTDGLGSDSAKNPETVKLPYKYTDSSTFEEEISEWFSYSEACLLLDYVKEFDQLISAGWCELNSESRATLVDRFKLYIPHQSEYKLYITTSFYGYIVTGSIPETISKEHLSQNIKSNTLFLLNLNKADILTDLNHLLLSYARKLLSSPIRGSPNNTHLHKLIFFNCLTILYFILSANKLHVLNQQHITQKYITIFKSLISIGSSFKPQEPIFLPVRHMLMLKFQILKVIFGSLRTIQNCKSYVYALANIPILDEDKNKLYASPSAYQAFRTQLILKYPTFSPPDLCFEVRKDSNNFSLYKDSPSEFTTTYHPYLLNPHRFLGNHDNNPFLFLGKFPVPASINEGSQLFYKRIKLTPFILESWHLNDLYYKNQRGWVSQDDTKKFINTYRDKRNVYGKKLFLLDQLYIDISDDINPFLSSLIEYCAILEESNYSEARDSLKPMATSISLEFSNENSNSISNKDFIRTKELTMKYLSIFLLYLLKWFKLSHAFKFEYLSQVIFDSSFIRMCLRSLCNEEKISNYSISDDSPNEFWSVCEQISGRWPLSENAIYLQADNDIVLPDAESMDISQDNDQSLELVSFYSPRKTFTFINFLKIIDNVCKNKPYRNFFMTTHKSSNILKKYLKLEQKELTLYILKIIKNQVPFCGRKWRQGNIKLISLIYLHCKQSLQENWISGNESDLDYESLYSQEIMFRSMICFYNNILKDNDNRKDATSNFFGRQISKLGLQNPSFTL